MPLLQCCSVLSIYLTGCCARLSGGADDPVQDRIGLGAAAEAQPLAGVLQKLLLRRQAAITRCAPSVAA